MPVQNVLPSWSEIPAAARRLLLHGSTGRDHLLTAARQVLSECANADPPARQRLMLTAQNMLLAAWGDAPLDGSLAELLLSTPLSGWPELPLPVANLLKAQANFWGAPAQGHPWWSAPDQASRLRVARQGLADEPRNLFWKLAAWNCAWPLDDWNLVGEVLAEVLAEDSWPRTLSPLRQRFAAQAFLVRGDAHSALASLNAAAGLAPFISDAGLRAECLLRIGQPGAVDEAAAVLGRSLRESPWRVSQLLRLSDLLSGAHAALAPLPGEAAILLYTFNKARELDETLASLTDSDFGGARVWALDNGSTDATAQVLSRWRERLGERLTLIRLPVNIGAPAARNWLLSLPEVRRHPFVAFLDDDVSLPGDWLPRLGAAVARFPEASVWGCRVVDDANPLVMQSVDLSPLPPGPEGPPLVLPSLHLGQPDLGQFCYLRPCVSVTGCCHLLREADIDTTGGFDIRFSPTQYDDLERDLRLALGGGFAVYQGHLSVRHKRRSGAAAERSLADMGNATANTHKLHTKHGVEDLRRLRGLGEMCLERDMQERMQQLKESHMLS